MSEAVRRARWVEAETIRLKRMGLSFEGIADQISRVGCGQAQPMVPTSEPISFPPGYQISRQACHKAFKKAFAREPALEVEELRKLDTERCEEMWMSLQPAIRKGNPPAVAVGVKVLSHKAKINGYDTAPPTVNTPPNIKVQDIDLPLLKSKVILLRDAMRILDDLGVTVFPGDLGALAELTESRLIETEVKPEPE